MSDEEGDRARVVGTVVANVHQHILRKRKALRPLAIGRCPRDGRLLYGAYLIPETAIAQWLDAADPTGYFWELRRSLMKPATIMTGQQIWLWSGPRRMPPAVYKATSDQLDQVRVGRVRDREPETDPVDSVLAAEADEWIQEMSRDLDLDSHVDRIDPPWSPWPHLDIRGVSCCARDWYLDLGIEWNPEILRASRSEVVALGEICRNVAARRAKPAWLRLTAS